MKILLSSCVLFIMLAANLKAQSNSQYYNDTYDDYENRTVQQGYGFAGFGIGLEYGGLGMKFGYNLADKLTLFSGLGYNFVGLGVNAGLSYDFAVLKSTSFYVSGMGGYNAVSVIAGAPEYTATFYGASLGFGAKFDFKKNPGKFIQAGLIIPFRNQGYRDMLDEIKNDPRIEGFVEPLPILICIGYNIGFN